MSIKEWVLCFEILKKMDNSFCLILGNEPWMEMDKLLTVNPNHYIPTSVYTGCFPYLVDTYLKEYLKKFNNISCGIDYPLLHVGQGEASMVKSRDAWRMIKLVREISPKLELHATVTIHKKNIHYLLETIDDLIKNNCYIGLNLIHYNKDGDFDFCGDKTVLKDLIFTKKDFPELISILKEVPGNSLIQSYTYIQDIIKHPEYIDMGWHCKGNPGSITIDCDGSLRLCGYRKGKRTSAFTIFDLPTKMKAWHQAIYEDSKDCPGCIWFCPWLSTNYDDMAYIHPPI